MLEGALQVTDSGRRMLSHPRMMKCNFYFDGDRTHGRTNEKDRMKNHFDALTYNGQLIRVILQLDCP